MIYTLMFLLLVLLWGSFVLNGKDLIAPSFIFCASFCFSCAWAVVYAERWELGLHESTFLVIFFGVLEFIIVSFFVQSAFTLSKGRKNIKERAELIVIKIEKWKKIFFLILSIFSVIYIVYSVVKVMNGNYNNIVASIRAYDNLIKFSDEQVSLPFLARFLKKVVIAAGYWFAYVVINNYLVEKKVDFLSLFIVIVSIISTVTTGGRNGAVNIILGCVAIIVLLIYKKEGGYKSIRFKTLIKFIIIAIIILSAFQKTGTLLGRTAKSNKSISAMNFFDYLAVYCGAEIKNLDLFLQEKNLGIAESVWKSRTFAYFRTWIGSNLGIDTSANYSRLKFRSVNNFNLGNVYTTFYDYIEDFNYEGEIVLVGIMAIISQWIYEKCRRAKLKNVPVMFIMIYSFIFSSLVLAFFSDKFYEQNFGGGFVYSLILWWLFDIFFCKIRTGNSMKVKM